jgi:hypothetical protein
VPPGWEPGSYAGESGQHATDEPGLGHPSKERTAGGIFPAPAAAWDRAAVGKPFHRADRNPRVKGPYQRSRLDLVEPLQRDRDDIGLATKRRQPRDLVEQDVRKVGGLCRGSTSAKITLAVRSFEGCPSPGGSVAC